MNTISLPSFYLKIVFVFIVVIISLNLQASAQIAYVGNSQLKAENKRNKREAARIETDYKETHLNTNYFTYKKGKASRKRVEVEEGWEDYMYNNPEHLAYTEAFKLKLMRKGNRKKK
ncbi:hypothetical protein [Adhaeribacter pallidiroseus]|uniref:Uncharacterized protein n=1 Tax=Adhaeribacter pallidiroseus TaxID=2072847 RepID=A0A369QIE5_9BACT|nr:hypothetical protein [Adhaeribacter pallidiroseus]RDC64683.1 hypothetical protein AHMF7616_03299 [Adhaeribacter pallidiroseus]